MINLTELGVEVFIKRSKTASLDCFWDNYNLIVWKKDNGGYPNLKGMFRNHSWGVVEKFSITDKGTWKIPNKYVRYFK